MTRTLADYRPQHDEYCASRTCSTCQGTTRFHREILSALDNPHPFEANNCTCGLDTLLAALRGLSPPQITEEKEDHARSDHPRVISGADLRVGDRDVEFVKACARGEIVPELKWLCPFCECVMATADEAKDLPYRGTCPACGRTAIFSAHDCRVVGKPRASTVQELSIGVLVPHRYRCDTCGDPLTPQHPDDKCLRDGCGGRIVEQP